MKLSLVEYSSGIDAPEETRLLIDRANKTIRNALNIKRNALVISDGKIRALGIAGSIRLSKNIELEIIPKMLDSQNKNKWKESLFLLAALSKHGNIITCEHIHSNTSYKDSLYDIAARILAREYSLHKRKYIRQYRRAKYFDYSIDGDINVELVFDKNPDGIPQERVFLDKINQYNATIQSAMMTVLPYVKETSTRNILNRAIQELGSQHGQINKKLKVPARNKEWTEVYNLAFDIVSGMGSSLDDGRIMSPGFVVDTWRIWEWLITLAFQIGLRGGMQVIPQEKIHWGEKKSCGKTSQINVFPDIAIYEFNNTEHPLFLVDAKYKIFSEKNSYEIDRNDLYEAFAFCKATGAKKIFLAYPAIKSNELEAGEVASIITYEIENITIFAVSVTIGSFSKQGDINVFCQKIVQNLNLIMAQHVV